MVTVLTEDMVRSLATPQSFERGQAVYRSGAIFHTTRQGDLLLGECEGSSAPVYHVRAEVNEGGVRSATCTCLYDWGGACKHVVALLLSFLHQPEVFLEQKSVPELLAGLEKDGMVVVIMRLVERHPDLYDELEVLVPAAAVGSASAAPRSAEKRHTQVSEAVYRKQVKRILKQSRYAEDDEFGNAPGYLDDLAEIWETADQFRDAGDSEGALIILRVLFEELLDDYDGEADYEGDEAAFIQSLGMPLADAILSVGMDKAAHTALQAQMQELMDTLDEAIEPSELYVILAALKYGWGDLPDDEAENENIEEDELMGLDDLVTARLNVLERQGRTEDYLRLAQEADFQRYALKLLELGRVDEAVDASQALIDAPQILSVAQKLHDAGRLKDALTLAERGLRQKGASIYPLATWLAPLEEISGRIELALESYQVAFELQPSIELYRHLKQLSGPGWTILRPRLMQKVAADKIPGVMVDIYLEEHDWDAAIALAEKQPWYLNLTETVADVVTPYRPDWVIRLALEQADALILKTQSNHYPAAARWLARAKQAYQAKGQTLEWQAYISNLRVNYARRPALMRAITGL